MSRREKLEQMLQANPDDLFLHYALAQELISSGDEIAGLAKLDDVLTRDPDYVPAWFQKAQLLARQDQVEQAREVAEQGIEVARRTGDSHAEGEMRGFLDLL